MKSISLTGLLVLCINCTQAQPTFERIFESAASGFKFNVLSLPSGNLLTPLGWGVSRLNPQGTIIQTRYYVPDTMVGVTSVRKLTDNAFYFATNYVKDSCTSSGGITLPFTHPAIGRMDSMGNVLALRHYVLDGCRNLTGDLAVMADHGAVTWGRDTFFFVLRTDSSLAPLWSRRFGHHGGFRFIKELPGGDLLAGFDMDTAGGSVARLDANGNFIWCKSYMRPFGKVHDAVIESDSSFIVTGYSSTTPYKLFIMKLDGAGEVQWCRGYDSAPNGWSTLHPSRIERTLDGNYVVLATLGQAQLPYFYRPLLMKTDLNGDTLWAHSVGRPGFQHYAMDVLAYSDGGYLLSGWIWGELPGGNLAMPYLFKTDSLGHYSCWESHHPVEVLELFPTDSSFALTSMDGVVEQPAFVSDIAFPITTYDGCTFSTGVPLWTRQSQKMSVRPNPNPGQFTLAFKEPLAAESWYSVFDPTGKLLYQRPLPPGKGTEEVDLSRYGKGTYVIKCTDKDGVYHERVVVE